MNQRPKDVCNLKPSTVLRSTNWAIEGLMEMITHNFYLNLTLLILACAVDTITNKNIIVVAPAHSHIWEAWPALSQQCGFRIHCYILVALTKLLTCFLMQFWASFSIKPSIAQLVERRTVDGSKLQTSLGRWFKSGSRDYFFLLIRIKFALE